jgi:peptidoglycan hydrolase-like protein with peptidoglycan-binding domain
MSGPAVAQLQRRLAALAYYPGPPDGRFGTDTLEAVWAFQEVQGLPVQDAASSAMQRSLANPRLPAVLVPGGGTLGSRSTWPMRSWSCIAATRSP